MSERVEWVVRDKSGYLASLMHRTEAEAIYEARLWDCDSPSDAPHSVVKRTITEEQVYP